MSGGPMDADALDRRSKRRVRTLRLDDACDECLAQLTGESVGHLITATVLRRKLVVLLVSNLDECT